MHVSPLDISWEHFVGMTAPLCDRCEADLEVKANHLLTHFSLGLVELSGTLPARSTAHTPGQLTRLTSGGWKHPRVLQGPFSPPRFPVNPTTAKSFSASLRITATLGFSELDITSLIRVEVRPRGQESRGDTGSANDGGFSGRQC